MASSRAAEQPAASSDADISRRINGERLVMFGWSRAILMQLAHPLVAAGVDEHSTFRQGPLKAALRLHQTIKAMLALTFGDHRRAGGALDGIRTIHRRVNGALAESSGGYAAGTRYSAEDPDLVLWVHSTLLESLPLAYDQLVTPLTTRERDRYCQESASTAVDLGAVPAHVPRSHAAAVRYVDGMIASDAIAVTRTARQLAEAVLRPSFGIAAGPAARWNRLITIGWLPPELRRQYGFSWSTRDERRMARAIRFLRLSRRAMPRQIALWPEAR